MRAKVIASIDELIDLHIPYSEASKLVNENIVEVEEVRDNNYIVTSKIGKNYMLRSKDIRIIKMEVVRLKRTIMKMQIQ